MQQASFGKRRLSASGLHHSGPAPAKPARIPTGYEREVPPPAPPIGSVWTPPPVDTEALLRAQYPGDSGGSKSLLVAYVLWLLGFGISAHRIYLGAFQSALAQMGSFIIGWAVIVYGGEWGVVWMGQCAVAMAGMWMVYDGLTLPMLCREMNAQDACSNSDAIFG